LFNVASTVGEVHEPPITFQLNQGFRAIHVIPLLGEMSRRDKRVTPHGVGRWHEVPEGTDAVSVAVPARNRPYDDNGFYIPTLMICCI